MVQFFSQDPGAILSSSEPTGKAREPHWTYRCSREQKSITRSWSSVCTTEGTAAGRNDHWNQLFPHLGTNYQDGPQSEHRASPPQRVSAQHMEMGFSRMPQRLWGPQAMSSMWSQLLQQWHSAQLLNNSSVSLPPHQPKDHANFNMNVLERRLVPTIHWP